MCGISGFLNTSATLTRDELTSVASTMSSKIIHRGPDSNGIWCSPADGVAMAHRRLSIIDLTHNGHQPMISHSGRFVIVFNGEIYNHLSMREKVKCNWRGGSDTETILEYISRYGLPHALREAIGMFSFALWDQLEKKLTLARDRIGEKPMYYGWIGLGDSKSFVFASELKAFAGYPGFDALIDRDSVAQFFRMNYIPAPKTIYEKIQKLLPGNILEVFSDGRMKVDSYWSLTDVAVDGLSNVFSGSDYDVIDRFDHLFSVSVKRQMVSDVPIGALLSGGIDSSLVAAYMQSLSHQPINTFTIGFDERDYNEAKIANEISDYLGTDHNTVILTGADALSVVPQISGVYDEPFADSSQLPTFMLMGIAKKNVTVALSGDGGDELFGGYNRYLFAPKIENVMRWSPQYLRLFEAKILSILGKISRHSIIANLIPIPQFQAKIDKVASILRSCNSPNEIYLSLTQEWYRNDCPISLSANHFAFPENNVLNTKINSFVHKMMLQDALTYLPDDILVKVDRASMFHSLEVRAPFLDRDLIEFAWRVPYRMKIRNGQGKWLLRELLKRHLPNSLIQKPKRGFSIPIDSWLRGPLREWAESLLQPNRIEQAGLLDPRIIRETYDAHQLGTANNGHRLWSILMFQDWMRLNSAST